MDIFIGKDWSGFLQVLLVIMERIQNIILNQSYEEVLITFTELTKNDFKLVTNGEFFDLKKSIKKYK